MNKTNDLVGKMNNTKYEQQFGISFNSFICLIDSLHQIEVSF